MGLINNLKAALFPEENADSPPAWIDRLVEARYSSLSGIEFPFLYLDLSTFYPLKSASFQSVDGDGAFVQSNGIGGLRFPCAMIFTGSDNDLQARTAIQALTERGDGTLYHPVHDRIDVVPGGEIEQFNGFVTAANQTVVTVELRETTGLLIDNLPPYPSVLDDYNESAAQSFADSINIADAADEVSLKNKILSDVGAMKSTLDKLSNGVAATQSALDDAFDSINTGMDTLIKDPLMLARQVQNLILTPSREIGLIKSKLEAYKNLASSIFGGTPKPNNYDFTASNDFASDLLMSGSMIAAYSQSSENNEFTTKKDLIKAAEEMDQVSNDFITFADDGAVILGGTNFAGDWQDLSSLSAIATNDLINAARDALNEITITTDTERAAADWCYELYGSIHNDKLWFFAETNDLGGDEILTIMPGRTLVYYE